jgi:hypothetical protein
MGLGVVLSDERRSLVAPGGDEVEVEGDMPTAASLSTEITGLEPLKLTRGFCGFGRVAVVDGGPFIAVRAAAKMGKGPQRDFGVPKPVDSTEVRGRVCTRWWYTVEDDTISEVRTAPTPVRGRRLDVVVGANNSGAHLHPAEDLHEVCGRSYDIEQ